MIIGLKSPADAIPPSRTANELLKNMLAARVHCVSVIVGPPGSGKTTAIVEMVSTCLRAEDTFNETAQRNRFALFAPSNSAADILFHGFRQLASTKRRNGQPWRILRVGEDAKISPEIREQMYNEWATFLRRNNRAQGQQEILKKSFYGEGHNNHRPCRSSPAPRLTEYRSGLKYTVAIVDEASQAHEWELLQPLHLT